MQLIARGLANPDTGFVALDLHRFYGVNITDRLLERRTWHWVRARADSLLNIPESITRKEALRDAGH
jgi:hypothetical protein